MTPQSGRSGDWYATTVLRPKVGCRSDPCTCPLGVSAEQTEEVIFGAFRARPSARLPSLPDPGRKPYRMNPFRKNVLVLFGAALLVALSVSSALGAKPTGSDSGPRGQTISGFVHALIAGDQEVTVDESPADEAPADEAPADEAPADEAPADEETSSDEDTSNEEDSTPADEDTSESSSDANAHGKCVAEIAQNPDEIGGDNENHGGAVSLAAETCPDGAADTAAADDVHAEMTAREEASAARAAAKEARMADKAQKAAARDARKAEQATAVHGNAGTHGGGHGH